MEYEEEEEEDEDVPKWGYVNQFPVDTPYGRVRN